MPRKLSIVETLELYVDSLLTKDEWVRARSVDRVKTEGSFFRDTQTLDYLESLDPEQREAAEKQIKLFVRGVITERELGVSLGLEDEGPPHLKVEFNTYVPEGWGFCDEGWQIMTLFIKHGSGLTRSEVVSLVSYYIVDLEVEKWNLLQISDWHQEFPNDFMVHRCDRRGNPCQLYKNGEPVSI